VITTYIVAVEDKPGVLTRVASLFRRRGYNIESLTVGHTETPGVSRMTIVVDVDAEGAHHVEAHLYKLVNVLRVDNVTHQPNVTRELTLIKVATSSSTRPEIFQLADVFRARIIDVSVDSVVLELTGGGGKLDRLLEVLAPYGVLEMARTGTLAMARGEGGIFQGPGQARPGATDEPQTDIAYSV
jgi:acetolactate synthase-1/3 small subunit